MTAEPFTLTKSEFDLLFEKLKNWGRWGEDDDLGTLNFVNEKEVVAAAALVRSGRRVSLARALDTVAGPDNGRPALHYMTSMGDQREDESAYYADFIGVDFHGKSASHMDALPHVAYKGLLYNGKRAADVVGSKGSSFAPVSRLARGIVARGVLLDAAHARRVDWVEPPCALGAADLEAIATTLGVAVSAVTWCSCGPGRCAAEAFSGLGTPTWLKLVWPPPGWNGWPSGRSPSSAATATAMHGRAPSKGLAAHPRTVGRRFRHVPARQPRLGELERGLR